MPNNNPKGKGGFQDHPELINKEGAPKRGQSWAETWNRITSMTRDEAIKHFGSRTRIGKLLRELPPNVPLKDGLAIIAVISFGRDPNPRMLATIMDREDGKPNQPISGKGGAPLFPEMSPDQIAQRVTQLLAAAKQRKDGN